jgi:hypothetical protein
MSELRPLQTCEHGKCRKTATLSFNGLHKPKATGSVGEKAQVLRASVSQGKITKHYCAAHAKALRAEWLDPLITDVHVRCGRWTSCRKTATTRLFSGVVHTPEGDYCATHGAEMLAYREEIEALEKQGRRGHRSYLEWQAAANPS